MGNATALTHSIDGVQGLQRQLDHGLASNVQVIQLKGALRVTTVDNFQVGF